MIEITVNGASRQIEPHTTVHDLLAALQLVGKRLAVERNGEIVPRGQHAATTLKADDQVEIVVAVGGG